MSHHQVTPPLFLKLSQFLAINDGKPMFPDMIWASGYRDMYHNVSLCVSPYHPVTIRRGVTVIMFVTGVCYK